MNDSTKSKILAIAHKLFAEYGFNGVSIRDLAKECDVNVSAINYHFKSKENLYIETVKESIGQTSEKVRAIYDNLKNPSIDELSMQVFDYFVSESEDLKTAFKLVMGQSNKNACIMPLSDDIVGYAGPPGGEYFAKCLMHEFPNTSQIDIDWAVRTLFTLIIHKSLVTCNESLMKSLCKKNITEDIIRNDITRLIKMIRQEFKGS